jgi:flagellar basal-body rod protein FlgC
VSDAFDIAASGMAAHRAEMDVIASNLANADTVQSGGSVFRARTPIYEPLAQPDTFSFADVLDDATPAFGSGFAPGVDGDFMDDVPGAQGVRLAGFADQTGAPQYRYDPGNPLAIASGRNAGFVATPDVDSIGQMVDLVRAGRAYDADIAALQAAKQMDVEAIEVDRS